MIDADRYRDFLRNLHVLRLAIEGLDPDSTLTEEDRLSLMFFASELEAEAAEIGASTGLPELVGSEVAS